MPLAVFSTRRRLGAQATEELLEGGGGSPATAAGGDDEVDTELEEEEDGSALDIESDGWLETAGGTTTLQGMAAGVPDDSPCGAAAWVAMAGVEPRGAPARHA